MSVQQQRSPKRHCMVVLACYPGAETRVQRQAEALVARDQIVDVICLRGPEESARECHRGVEVYRLNVPVAAKAKSLPNTGLMYLHFFVQAFLKLALLSTRHPYNVVQVHNLPDFLVFCAFVPKLQGVPIVLDLHDLMPEFYAGRGAVEGFPRWLAKGVNLQERLACRFADHVITVSEHWRQALIGRGVPAGKCDVVMNVPDDGVFRPARERPGPGNGGKFRLLYHGTLVYRYGLDLAIRAVDLVRHEVPGVHMTISGVGNYLPELNNLTRDLGLDGHVTIHGGYRPLGELSELIQSADVGIVPYRNDVFTSGILPTKLMEYVACDLPCIAARTAAIESHFDGVVEFFEPGNAEDLARCITRLYRSPERLRELSIACQGFRQKYNWTNAGAEYVALMERLGSRQTRCSESPR